MAYAQVCDGWHRHLPYNMPIGNNSFSFFLLSVRWLTFASCGCCWVCVHQLKSRMPKTLKSRGRNKTKKKSTHIQPARERWRRTRHSFSKFFLIIFQLSANFSWIAKSGQRQVHVTLFASLFRCWQWNCKSWIVFVCLLLNDYEQKQRRDARSVGLTY